MCTVKASLLTELFLVPVNWQFHAIYTKTGHGWIYTLITSVYPSMSDFLCFVSYLVIYILLSRYGAKVLILTTVKVLVPY